MSADDTTSDQGQHSEASSPSISEDVEDSPADPNTTHADLNKGEIKPMSRFEVALVILTIFGILVGIGTGVIFYGQFQEMIGQTDMSDIAARQARNDSANAAKTVERQLKIAQDQADAARDNATAIKRQTNSANKQAILSQRAWIAVTAQVTLPPGISPLPTDPFIVGKDFDLRVKFKNTGRTPAIHLRASTKRQGVEPDKDGNFPPPDFKSYPIKDSPQMGILTPDGERYADFISVLTAEDRDRFIAGKVRVYVFGRIEYEDVFGGKHWNTFCGFIMPTGAMALCTYYNEMDKN